MKRPTLLLPASLMLLAGASCGGGEAPAANSGTPAATTKPAPKTAADLPNGLLLALSKFEVSPEGKVIPKPLPASLHMLRREGGEWKDTELSDPDSNVFHKAMVYAPPGREPGILTLGGSQAAVKMWRPDGDGWKSETLWQKDFGGRFSRMRDAEIGDILHDGPHTIAVATHDQGIVSIIEPDSGSGWKLTEIDAKKDTFVHEIELGDVDGDGTLEVYATPSDPNKADAAVQHGEVVRYVPKTGEGRKLVADLGDRHAKEIYVGDVDGDDRDDLYVSVEAVGGGKVQIVRYEADTPADQGAVVARLSDTMCRFLTVGDLDGDGKKEMVAAAKSSGVWLLRPGADPNGTWHIEQIDHDSSGFEHAALLTDLDGDGKDELYVASDDAGELRRYVWTGDGYHREVIFKLDVRGSAFFWNMMPYPVDLLH